MIREFSSTKIMASVSLFNSAPYFLHPPNTSLRRPLQNPPSTPTTLSVRFSGGLGSRETRGSSVVLRAVPGPNAYLFAFLFPLSLLAATIFTSIRIADKLDNDFLQELAVNQAILEGSEDDEDDDPSINEEPERPRTRNRPKRQAEISSM